MSIAKIAGLAASNAQMNSPILKTVTKGPRIITDLNFPKDAQGFCSGVKFPDGTEVYDMKSFYEKVSGKKVLDIKF